jgi:hypothetical protein
MSGRSYDRPSSSRLPRERATRPLETEPLELPPVEEELSPLPSESSEKGQIPSTPPSDKSEEPSSSSDKFKDTRDAFTARTLASLAAARPQIPRLPPIHPPALPIMSGAAAAAAAAATAAAAAAANTSRSEIKVKSPENFDGKPEHVNQWLGSVKRYLDINNHIYHDDERKVLFALSYMQDGPAESWVEDFTNDTVTIVTSGQAKGYGTFAAFRQLIINDFGPANTTASAMQDLTKLKQANCGSLTDYISEFKLLAGRAGITQVESYQYFFHKGINQGLMRSILQDELPTTNQDLIKKALSKQANFEEMTNLRNIFSGGNSKKNSMPKKSRFHDSKDPNAMEVDRLSEQERADHFKKGLCFNCHEPGHKSNNPRFHPKEKGNKGKGKSVRHKTPNDKNPTPETSKIEEISEEEDSDEDEDKRRLDF